MTQDELNLGLQIAEDKEYFRKTTALKMFIIPEGYNEPIKPKKHGRYFNRKGSLRPSANKKERIKQTKIREETPVL